MMTKYTSSQNIRHLLGIPLTLSDRVSFGSKTRGCSWLYIVQFFSPLNFLKKSSVGKSYKVHFFDRPIFFAEQNGTSTRGNVCPSSRSVPQACLSVRQHRRSCADLPRASEAIISLKLVENLHHTHQQTSPRIPRAVHHRPPAGSPL